VTVAVGQVSTRSLCGPVLATELTEELPPEELPLDELPMELLEAPLPSSEAVLITTVAEVGAPKPAAPLMDMSVRANSLPAPAAVTGTDTTLGDESPSPQLSTPLV
jgi:hypothetical protein